MPEAINADTLFSETKCYACLGMSLPQLLELGLLSRISTDVASAAAAAVHTDMQAANYGGVAPVWAPVGTLGIAVDTVTERVWWYYSGAWH